jgi:hypothetical protein
VDIHPNPGLTFNTDRLTYVYSVVFEGDRYADPPSVMCAIGRRGGRLGAAWINPEVGLNSGGQYLAEEAFVQ